MTNTLRIAPGTLTASALQATATYAWLAQPVQPDRTLPGVAWPKPLDDAEGFFKPARIEATWDAKRRADGYYSGYVCFRFVTHGQLVYYDSKMGFSDTVWSVAATVQVPKRGWTSDPNGWEQYTCIAHRPIPGADYEERYPGIFDLYLRFDNGVIV